MDSKIADLTIISRKQIRKGLSVRQCKSCGMLSKRQRIVHPEDLKRIIREVKGKIKNGCLVEEEYWPKGHVRLYQEPFDRLSEDGPWPDYIEYYFRCVECDQLFCLKCETYHGMGGSWEISCKH